MFELIRVDVINGSRTSHKEYNGTIFHSKEEREAFRATIQDEHPGDEVCLTYRDLRTKSPAPIA